MLNVALNSNWLQEQSNANGDSIAIKSEEVEITYSQLHEFVKNRSSQIENLHKPKVLAIPAHHSLQFIIDFLAGWNLGYCILPINPNLKAKEIESQITFVDGKMIGSVISETTKRNLTEVNIYEVNCNALIMFTSGSTGVQKAVLHTFKSLYASSKTIDKVFNFNIAETWLASLPFYRIGGLQIILRSLLSGGTLCLPTGVKTTDLIKAIKIFSPNYISTVNASLQALAEIENPQTTKAIFAGGGPIDKNLLERCIKKKLPIFKVYGSTETGSMISMLNLNQHNKKINTAGKPLPNISIKTYNGEILVKSDSLFKEYINNKKLTSEKLVDGWFFTGDYGYMDSDGFLIVEGRLDDIIISGGEKIIPSEIEKTILEIDAIKETKVFGLYDEKWGEKVCAIFISDENINEIEIQQLLTEKLPSYKIPKVILQVDEIPKNEMGKVDISILKKLFT